MERDEKGRESAEPAGVLPVMNIMFLLIPALLLAMETATMAAIDVSTPQTRAAAGPQAQESAAELDFRVHIRSDGFSTHAGAGALSTGEEVGIPLVAGDHDYAALEVQARALKLAHPEQTVVIITAEGDVPLSTLVATMDALRGSDCSAKEAADSRECLFWEPVIQRMG